MKAYYFARNDNKLHYGDNREIVVGRMHMVKCEPILCRQGLHGSVKPLDALKYAPGSMLYAVDISRNIAVGADKICGQRRKYLFGFDATETLSLFARKQALMNIEKIKPYTDKYDLIVEYLNIGAGCLKSAAESAAWSAARSAAYSAAESAAWSAARSAAYSAAESAANEMLEDMIISELTKRGYNHHA